jgi:hypothetical protein
MAKHTARRTKTVSFKYVQKMNRVANKLLKITQEPHKYTTDLDHLMKVHRVLDDVEKKLRQIRLIKSQ